MTHLKIHIIEEDTGRMIANDRIAQAPRCGDEISNGQDMWIVNRVVWVLDERTSDVIDRINVGVTKIS
jgi:hypothetical protein